MPRSGLLARARLAVAVAVTLLVALLAGSVRAEAATGGQATTPTAGGESTGDSLFPDIGNTGYDVQHYAIWLGLAPRTGRIAASTTLTATADHPLSSFSLDLEGLRVFRVLVDGAPATFARHDAKLVVTPAHAVSGRFTVKVRYGGVPTTHIDPDGAQDGWVRTDDGATVVSEPVGAMTWFPNNNTPRDKATYRLRVTVPRSLAVAANGDLVRRHTHDGRTTWTWRQTRQMASYLAMVSIGRYDVYHSTMRTTSGRRLPIWSFVQPDLGRLVAQRRVIPEVVRFAERRFGPYPLTSVGIVVDSTDVGYALETQNRPVFDGAPDTSTIVHELAHQWYGDSLTLRDWRDIWLHEGFATYAEDLWAGAHGGPAPRVAFEKRYADNPASSRLWRPAPARFDDPADLFGSPVYTRGGMTLQALRNEIGSRDFATVLHRWAALRREGSVSTPGFVALAERVSGRDLGSLFRDWLLTPRRPSGY